MMEPHATMAWLVQEQMHLVVQCNRHGCFRRERWSPRLAALRLGAGCTLDDARRRLKCSACGASGRKNEIDVRPCSIDYGVKIARARHAREVAEYGSSGFDLEAELATCRRLAGGPVSGDPEMAGQHRRS